eukprot:1193339-Prorocentrum_minimum.AAC.2
MAPAFCGKDRLRKLTFAHFAASSISSLGAWSPKFCEPRMCGKRIFRSSVCLYSDFGMILFHRRIEWGEWIYFRAGSSKLAYTWRGSQSHYRAGYIPGGGANHTTEQGIYLKGEPSTLYDRVYTWRGSQSHYRAVYIPGGGANRTI